MNSTKSVFRKPAATLGCLLLFSIVTASPVIAAPPQTPTEIADVRLEEETFFVEVRQAERRNEGFVESFAQLRASIEERKVRVEEVWAGEPRLYLKLAVPADTIAGRNALVDEMLKLPLVAKVISSHAAPSELSDLHRLQKFASRAALPEGAMRGFPAKRRDYKPNLAALHSDEIIVKYLEAEADTPARMAQSKSRVASIHSAVGARVIRTLDVDGLIELLALPKDADLQAVLQSYLDSEDVEFAQPNYLYQPSAIPTDPRYSEQWALPKISAPAAWDVNTDASSVVVAVVDSGIDYTHPDLSGNMWNNPNPGVLGPADGIHGGDFYNNNSNPMDTAGHGTHVAGIIGAYSNNAVGVAGVAWRVKLMAVRVQRPDEYFDSSAIMSGLDYARQKGAKIVNASWGSFELYLDPDYTLSPPAYDPLVEGAIRRLKDAGVLFVNASGNSAWNCDEPGYEIEWPFDLWGVPVDPDDLPWPWDPYSIQEPWNYEWRWVFINVRVGPGHLSLPNMLVVNSTDISDAQSGFSNYGGWSTDLHAPGGFNQQWQSILSTFPGNQYVPLFGTSMAAPHVSGVLALAMAEFPSESWWELVERARFSIDPVGSLSNLSVSGGRLNAAKALGTRPRMVNLSTRCQVNTGHQVAIAGVAIGGPASKQVAFRALGPTLGNGSLQNPQITNFNGSGQAIGYNDDWGTLSAADKAVLASVGATPPNPLESAWVGTLAPGAYTVHLSGVSGTGLGLIEAYDADSSTQNRLINISTRCYVGTGDQVAIAGTFVSGDKTRIVYIRAMGPTLGTYGVPEPLLHDPVITLFQGSTQVASNNNWGGGGTPFGTRIVEDNKAPGDYRESALIARLEPNTSYTVHLSGNGSTTGVGIIEVYEY